MAHFAGQSLMRDGQYKGKINLKQDSSIAVEGITEFLQVKPDFYDFSSISESMFSESSLEQTSLKKYTEIFRDKAQALKETRCEKLKSSQKLLDTLIIIASITGLLSETYNFEYNFTGDMAVRYRSQEMNNLIRIISSILTGLCIVLAIQRSFVAYQLKREKKFIFESRIKSYIYSSSFITLVIDIFILIVHAPPYIDFEIEFQQMNGVLYLNFGSICLAFMQLRYLYLLRAFSYYTKWSTTRSQKILKVFKVKHPLRFALKSCLSDTPHFFLIPIFGVSIFALGVSLQVFERPFNEDNLKFADNPNSAIPPDQDFSYLYNSMWLVVITMSTVGYGDFFARTHMGRFISVIAIVLGTFLFSLLILMFNDLVKFTRPQEKSFNFLSKFNTNREVQNYAAKIIGTMIEVHVYRRYRKIPLKDPIFKQKRREILHYRCLFRQKKNELKFKTVNIKDSLLQINENLGLDLNKLEKILDMANDTEFQLDAILQSQKKTLDLLLQCFKFSNELNQLMSLSTFKN